MNVHIKDEPYCIETCPPICFNLSIRFYISSFGHLCPCCRSPIRHTGRNITCPLSYASSLKKRFSVRKDNRFGIITIQGQDPACPRVWVNPFAVFIGHRSHISSFGHLLPHGIRHLSDIIDGLLLVHRLAVIQH